MLLRLSDTSSADKLYSFELFAFRNTSILVSRFKHSFPRILWSCTTVLWFSKSRTVHYQGHRFVWKSRFLYFSEEYSLNPISRFLLSPGSPSELALIESILRCSAMKSYENWEFRVFLRNILLTFDRGSMFLWSQGGDEPVITSVPTMKIFCRLTQESDFSHISVEMFFDLWPGTNWQTDKPILIFFRTTLPSVEGTYQSKCFFQRVFSRRQAMWLIRDIPKLVLGPYERTLYIHYS